MMTERQKIASMNSDDWAKKWIEHTANIRRCNLQYQTEYLTIPFASDVPFREGSLMLRALIKTGLLRHTDLT